MPKTAKNVLYCSFCGKSQHEVVKLIAGPIVFICDACTMVCFDVIMNDLRADQIEELFLGVPENALEHVKFDWLEDFVKAAGLSDVDGPYTGEMLLRAFITAMVAGRQADHPIVKLEAAASEAPAPAT
jgi:hypothetical protein